jgi:hypothetical protein
LKEARTPLPQISSFLTFVNQVLNITHLFSLHQFVTCPEGWEEKKESLPAYMLATLWHCASPAYLPADSIGRTGQRIGTRTSYGKSGPNVCLRSQSTSIINIEPSHPGPTRALPACNIFQPPPPRTARGRKGEQTSNPSLGRHPSPHLHRSASHKIFHPQSSSRFAAARGIDVRLSDISLGLPLRTCRKARRDLLF